MYDGKDNEPQSEVDYGGGGGGFGDGDSDSKLDDLDFTEKETGKLYHDFMPMYETVTKLGKGLGPEGRGILSAGMRGMRAEMMAAQARRQGAKSDAGMPATLTKTTHERIGKTSSPSKGKGKGKKNK